MFDLTRNTGFQAEELRVSVPSKPVNMPTNRTAITQVNQLKAAGQFRNISRQQSAPSSAQIPGTLGLPLAPVSMKVTQRSSSTTTKELTVSWQRDPSDQNYQSANIYTQSGNNQPTFVGYGHTAPIKITMVKNNMPVTVLVQHVGKGGTLPIEQAFTRTIRAL